MASMQVETRHSVGQARGRARVQAKGTTGRKRTPVCPFCRENDEVIPILYGFPSDKGFLRAERGEVYLGGYIEGSTTHYCKRDDKEF